MNAYESLKARLAEVLEKRRPLCELFDEIPADVRAKYEKLADHVKWMLGEDGEQDSGVASKNASTVEDEPQQAPSADVPMPENLAQLSKEQLIALLLAKK
ncbi:hypothetical protein AAVH_10663 [Aphelenchoides avenae]|nr:hypothetical protein AAVH_10663 [Aphelenchus avenae]